MNEVGQGGRNLSDLLISRSLKPFFYGSLNFFWTFVIFGIPRLLLED